MKDAFYTIWGIMMYYIKYKKFLEKKNEKIELFQFKKLKRLLIECQEVPYYKNLFHSIDFNPKKDFKTLSDLSKIPILKKDIVRDNPELFLHPKYSTNSLVFCTSGTTGAPFTAYVSPKHWVVEQAVIWRHWKRSGFKLFDNIAILRSLNPKSEKELIKIDKIRNWVYYSPYHLNDRSMLKFYNDMLQRRVKFLRGYPSSLNLFAEFCSRNGFKLPDLKACLTASEVLTTEERSVIENAFNVKVHDHYGLAEAIVMLHNDGNKTGYYNCEEYGFLELIETEEKEKFKIIGTNLNNYAMPLIRYDTEDLAEVFVENKNEIKRIIGRKDTYIQSPTTKIPTVNYYTTFYKVKGIVQWQLIQNNITFLDLYLKIKEGYDFSDITNQINSLNNTDLKIHFHETNIFTLTGEGKLKPFINNL
jgi:phenylacetate-CoA ligase